MKNELGRKALTKFVELNAKAYNYFIDDDSENKKSTKAQKGVL